MRAAKKVLQGQRSGDGSGGKVGSSVVGHFFLGAVLPMQLGEGWGRMVAACGLTMVVGEVVSEEVKETAGKIEYVDEGVCR